MNMITYILITFFFNSATSGYRYCLETFNFEALQLPPTFGLETATKNIPNTIPVKKPKSGLEFFRAELRNVALSIGKLRQVAIYTDIRYLGQVFISNIFLNSYTGGFF